MIKPKQTLILGSSSPARNTLLQRLGIEFSTHIPDIDETLLPNEEMQHAITRLAQQKAEATAKHHPKALIIACDQLVSVDNEILGKPHTHIKAIKQLQQCSNKTLYSATALCVLNAATHQQHDCVIPYQVTFKKLTRDTIERYLKRDRPYHCAGSIKAEGLGITLFKSMHGDDPTALIGLPLMALTKLLTIEGCDPLGLLKRYQGKNSMNWLWVAIGGTAGCLVRYALVTAISQLNFKPFLPYGTMAVNIIGCFAIGILAAIGHMKHGGLRIEIRLTLMVGFLGGFTTFSSFGLEAFELLKHHHPMAALLDIAIQVILGFIAVGAGFWLGGAVA